MCNVATKLFLKTLFYFPEIVTPASSQYVKACNSPQKGNWSNRFSNFYRIVSISWKPYERSALQAFSVKMHVASLCWERLIKFSFHLQKEF